ncbi:replicase helicase endonuclease [Labeo rohita]|uniref:Replicase helicase endonuclease n=1 Tax=Labeo rohita TaxID=84645 RepID=A0A498L7D5_LABRO|nr:replicase helicase endonuclease [Labeo rohita]
MYMLSYISKPEHEMNDFLKNVIKGVRETNVNEEDEMKNIMQAYSKHRQVNAQESVARTCSLPMKKCSRNVVFIPTDDDALKMSLPLSALHNKDPDSEDVWMSGMIDKYRARPRTLEFEMMCLADFVSNYRVVYGRQTKGKNVHQLLNGWLCHSGWIVFFALLSTTNNRSSVGSVRICTAVGITVFPFITWIYYYINTELRKHWPEHSTTALCQENKKASLHIKYKLDL